MDTVDGYTKRLDRRLKNAAQGNVVRPAFKPGSRFVREYHGITHVVGVGDGGRFVLSEMKNLEKENQRLKKIVADLELDKLILKESLDYLKPKA